MGKQKVRLCLKHGVDVTVKVDDFSVRRGPDGVPTEWNASGVEGMFGFAPKDLVFWQVIA